jgi:hypothetical protein
MDAENPASEKTVGNTTKQTSQGGEHDRPRHTTDDLSTTHPTTRGRLSRKTQCGGITAHIRRFRAGRSREDSASCKGLSENPRKRDVPRTTPGTSFRQRNHGVWTRGYKEPSRAGPHRALEPLAAIRPKNVGDEVPATNTPEGVKARSGIAVQDDCGSISGGVRLVKEGGL